MCGYELHVGPQRLLNLIDYASLDSGDIGDERAAFEERLILLYPIDELLGIKGEDYDVETTYKLFCYISCTTVDYAVFKGLFDSALAP